MKKKHLSSLAVAAAMTAALAGCQQEEHMPAGKTPLSLAGITVEVTGTATRADVAAADFFRDGDIATITVTPIGGGGTVDHAYTYTDAGFTPDGKDIYLEDVYDGSDATHTFLFEYGNPELVSDQSTAAGQHTADAVSGALTLYPDARTLTADDPLQRRAVRLVFKIEQGTGWASGTTLADIMDEVSAVKVHHATAGSIITPLNEGISTDVITFSAILPPADVISNTTDALLTLTWSGDRPPAVLKLDADFAPAAGQQYTITATLNAGDAALALTGVTLTEWAGVSVWEDDPPVAEKSAVTAQQ